MHNNSRITIGLVTIGVVAILLIVLFPVSISDVYAQNYVVDAICLLASIILLISLYLRGKLDLFEPITFISLIYIAMFFCAPIHDIISGELYWFGYDLFPYGIKATLIAFLGYCVFFFCYSSNYDLKLRSKKRVAAKQVNEMSYFNPLKSEIISICLVMYLFCFGTNAFYLARAVGNSLLYSLSLGLLGAGNTRETLNAPLGFISMFSFCLPTITLIYWEYSGNKWVARILFVAMFMLQVARGFRFYIIQIAVTFFSYHYIKKNKRPKIISIVCTLFALMIPVIIMTMFRNSIRSGAGMNLSALNVQSIREAFNAAIWENLRIYRNFYAMVNRIPSQYPYVYGRQMILGTLIMFVPRIIWPTKLPSAAGVGLEYIVGMNLIGTGQAYPNIGEYYYAIGVIGVIICMAIYGYWAKRLKRKLMDDAHSNLDIIEYSVLLGCNLQLIIRGYTPGNFWYLVFSVMPLAIVKKLHNKNNLEKPLDN